eukprot:gnl/MRDRNA2_/MRDRNA2_29950_c0_seq2.p1 gnl/MRDRNA2_/MRDRNA2_29950_c0~~gnl/MRDRNA2_/MRDRNA2_29950_c0_seq2.p1  ORF type:complete len:444 (+),score=82.89 gnl/MRDRNA2_/MRDRNA2_29950_c0_seq2:44-1375(+)
MGKSSVLQGMVTASGMGGAFLAAVVAAVIADWIGRRKEMLIAAVCYLLGSMLEVASGSFHGEVLGITILSVGRCLFGVGCGFATHAAPAYIAEMSPPSLRGTLVSLKEAAIVAGMVLGYVIGYALADVVAGWRFLYGVGFVLAIVYGIGVWRLPRSARWLVLQDQRREALESLKFFLNDGVDEVLCEICDQVELVQKSEGTSEDSSILQKLFSARISRPLVLGLGLVTFQQISGQPSVLYYAQMVFKSVGVGSEATVGVGVFKFLMTMFSVYNVETRGRKHNLIVGTCMMVAALFVLSTTLKLGGDQMMATPGLDVPKAVVIVAMLLYVGGYQVGFGPVVWLLVSEIFPLDVRGTAVAFAVQANFFWNVLTTFTVPIMFSILGESITFGIFGIIAVVALFFIEEFVVETKGLSLEEIEHIFQSKTASDVEDRVPLLGERKMKF